MRIAFVAGLLVIAGLTVAFTVQDKEAKAYTNEDAEMMRKYMELMTPGEHHAYLQDMVGTWNATVKHWMMPDAPVTESSGTATFRTIFDGRYGIEEFDGESMGMPFKGMGIFAFNNVTQQHESIWFDSMGTGFNIESSECDGMCKTFNGESHFDDPMTGERTKHRTAGRQINENEFVYEMYRTQDGREFKTLEVNYTR